MDDLIETWRAHSAIGLYLLSNLPEGGLDAAPIAGGMRVGQQFAHISDLRLRWVDNAAPDLTAQLPWFERQAEPALDAAVLSLALQRSAGAVEALIRRCAQADCGVKDFPGPLAAFLGYLISHESYHWGEVGLALSQSGLPLDMEVALGIWRGWWGRDTTSVQE
ncbi:MAG TPA: DinB family protein [Roseiflexaceae bacterium]|nr:DinB family protein [Roseiflexaceae bacterium]